LIGSHLKTLIEGGKMTANKALVTDTRRMEKRYDCEAKIKWSYFNKDRYFDAKILNCSQNGTYFETPHEIKPGVTILIRVENLISKNMISDEHLCLRTVSLADVKWCRDSSQDGNSCFGVGARHFDIK
jgi:hypothetical protein